MGGQSSLLPIVIASGAVGFCPLTSLGVHLQRSTLAGGRGGDRAMQIRKATGSGMHCHRDWEAENKLGRRCGGAVPPLS